MNETSTIDRHTRAIALLSMMEGAEGSALADSRAKAWDYYLQRPRGDEVEGRSPVVTGDVSAMVESTLSQVSEAIATDNLAEFEGISEQDEFQAKLEGKAVSSLIMRGPGWFRLASCVKNALLLRMGVMRAEICDSEEVTVYALEGVGRFAKALMEVRGRKIVDYDPETGIAHEEVAERRRYLDIVNVNAENFLFVTWPLDDFENIPACAERRVTTRQQLIDEEKISEAKVDALKATYNPRKSDEEAHALRRYTNATRGISQRQQLLEWFVLYYLHNGKRYRAIVADNSILAESPTSKRPPYAIGVPFINPGHVDGFSIFDKLKSTQDNTTALTRMLHDNAEAVTMNRLAVLENAANKDQLTDQDPTGVLQIKRSVAGGDVRNAVMQIQSADLSAGMIAGLEYQRSVRSEMAGASLDVGTGKVQLPDRMGSMGLDRAYSASEQLSSLILKTFAQSLIKDLWLLVHELLRTQWTGELSVKVDGRWHSPKPSDWPRRQGVEVKPGMSPGERARKSMALGKLIDSMTSLAEKGMEGILVDAERYYRALCDWARLNDISNPEQYLIDPSSDAAKAEFKRKADQAGAQAAQAQQLQQMALALEQMKIAMEKYGIDVKAAVEKYKTDAQTDTKEAELTIGLVQSREGRQVAAAAPKEPKESKATEAAEGK